MAFALTTTHAFRNTLAAPTTQAFSGSVTTGNLLLVGASNYDAAATVTAAPTDTIGTAYHGLGLFTDAAAQEMWWGIAPSSGANTVSMTWSGIASGGSMSVAEFSGLTSNFAVDGTPAHATFSGTHITTPQLVTTKNAGLVIFKTVVGDSSGTAGAPWTLIDTGMDDPWAYRANGAAGTYSPDVTFSSSENGGMMIAAFGQGTYAVIGHPINVAGVMLAPGGLTVNASLGTWYQATNAVIPIASLAGGAAEASALIGIGNATLIA